METASIITAVAALVSALAGALGGIQWGRRAERKAQDLRVKDERTRKPGSGVVIMQPGIEVRMDGTVDAARVINALQAIQKEGQVR